MRAFDPTSLYRSTVGFDRLFTLLDTFSGPDAGGAPSYPPYNIERLGENDYRISIAVAGFAEADLNIEVHDNALTVKGERGAQQDGAKKGELLYQGIAARAFERRFQLADYVQVKGANLENGLLHIELVREVPEAKKPRTIAIGDVGAAKPQVIDSRAAA